LAKWIKIYQLQNMTFEPTELTFFALLESHQDD